MIMFESLLHSSQIIDIDIRVRFQCFSVDLLVHYLCVACTSVHDAVIYWISPASTSRLPQGYLQYNDLMLVSSLSRLVKIISKQYYTIEFFCSSNEEALNGYVAQP